MEERFRPEKMKKKISEKTRGLKSETPSLEEIPEWAEVLGVLILFTLIFIGISLTYGFRTVDTPNSCIEVTKQCHGIPTGDQGLSKENCVGLYTQDTEIASENECRGFDQVKSACQEQESFVNENTTINYLSCGEWASYYNFTLPEK